MEQIKQLSFNPDLLIEGDSINIDKPCKLIFREKKLDTKHLGNILRFDVLEQFNS